MLPVETTISSQSSFSTSARVRVVLYSTLTPAFLSWSSYQASRRRSASLLLAALAARKVPPSLEPLSYMVTSWPRCAAIRAHSMPDTPPPMTATFFLGVVAGTRVSMSFSRKRLALTRTPGAVRRRCVRCSRSCSRCRDVSLRRAELRPCWATRGRPAAGGRAPRR